MESQKCDIRPHSSLDEGNSLYKSEFQEWTRLFGLWVLRDEDVMKDVKPLEFPQRAREITNKKQI